MYELEELPSPNNVGMNAGSSLLFTYMDRADVVVIVGSGLVPPLMSASMSIEGPMSGITSDPNMANNRKTCESS